VARFSEVTRGSLYESVAASIEEAILKGDVKQGEKLPSEQSLARQFGVSRNILREALKAVRARGLLDVRNGDGSYVARPDSADLGAMLRRVLLLSDTVINDYFEIRFALEVTASELASLRATEEQIGLLQSIVDQMAGVLTVKEELARLDFEFHLGVARATGNPLFPCFLEPMRQLMTDMFHFAYPDPAGLDDSLASHARIVRAIRERDPGAAREAMSRHLQSSVTNVAQIVHRSRETDQGGQKEGGSTGAE